MPRALFEKSGRAIYISHLDLMRVFQRAFQRAGLPLTHTQGFNPRPSVSIALPLSLGVESVCELLDFDLYGEPIPVEEICARLNAALIDGVTVREVYEGGGKIKNLAYLDCALTMEYDSGVPQEAESAVKALFSREEILMEKRNRNGVRTENIIPMIRTLDVTRTGEHTLELRARVCCQNPVLNPMQMAAAIETHLPQYRPDFVKCRRTEIYDVNEEKFR